MIHRVLESVCGGRWSWSLTGSSFFEQVLQGQADGVVFHGAGDKMGRGPVQRAAQIGRAPRRGAGLVEMFHHGMDY